MNYRAKKVKILDDGIEIKFDRVHPKAPDIVIAEMTIKTSYMQAEAVKNSVFDLHDEFLEITGLISHPIDRLMVKEVSIKSNEEKGMGVQLIAELSIPGHTEAAVIKTPVLWEDSEDKRDNMSGNLLTLVKEIQYEADGFIENERNAQIEMFAEAV